MSDTPSERKYVTNHELQLEIKALRSDFKLWILAAVALNQFLGAVDLHSPVTGAVIGGVLLKAAIAAGTAKFGGS